MKSYEIKDHLGNVAVTISDMKHPLNSGDPQQFYADVEGNWSYYPFGMPEPIADNTGYVDDYRYGFNGMERDDEVKGSGNSLDFGARIYDPRVGRWLSRDPLWKKYPSTSSFSFAINNPIKFIDPDGGKVDLSGEQDQDDKKYLKIALSKVNAKYIYLDKIVYNYYDEMKVVMPSQIDESDYNIIAKSPSSQPIINITMENINGKKRSTKDLNRLNNKDKVLVSKSKTFSSYSSDNAIYTIDAYTGLTNEMKNWLMNKMTNDVNDGGYFDDVEHPKKEEIERLANDFKIEFGENAVKVNVINLKVDDAPSGDAGHTIGHEFGGIIYEIQNPVESLIFQRLEIRTDYNSKDGHYPNFHPHAIGAQMGEDDNFNSTESLIPNSSDENSGGADDD